MQFSLPLAISAPILLICISLLWLFQLLIGAQQDIARDEITTIVGFCLFVIALQAFVLFLLPRYMTLLFVSFAVINTYSLYFIFSSDLTARPTYQQILLLLAIGTLYFTLIQFMRDIPRLRGWIATGAALSIAALGIVGVAPIIAGPGHPPESSTRPEFEDTRIVEFTRRPNVYFLGFDALMPESLTSKLLQIEKPAYVDVIAKHGGTIIPNSFADQVATKRFWATIMNIVPSQLLRGRGIGALLYSDALVLGIEPSPVLATFLHNKYNTHFTFWNGYFGSRKGSYLTSYTTVEPYSTCSFLNGHQTLYGFLGYCISRGRLSTKRAPIRWLFLRGASEAISEQDNRQGEFYFDHLRSVMHASSSKPYFFASHFMSPGHTSSSYQRSADEFQEFRKQYRTRSENAANVMDKMLSEIRATDPTAIIFVFGDHGSLVSRGLDYADDPTFVVQDRHGNLNAVFGAEQCMPFLQPPEGEKIQTSSRIVAGLLQCLAGGESPLIRDHDFGRITQAPGNMRFEDYAYE